MPERMLYVHCSKRSEGAHLAFLATKRKVSASAPISTYPAPTEYFSMNARSIRSFHFQTHSPSQENSPHEPIA